MLLTVVGVVWNGKVDSSRVARQLAILEGYTQDKDAYSVTLTGAQEARMRVSTVVLFVLVVLTNAISVPFGQAQEEDAISHCLDMALEPVPLSAVDVSGMLLVAREDGVQVVREAIDTPYFIALSDHYRLFASKGSVSPDGRWFAFPTGWSERANWMDRHYHFERMQFVNTYTGERIFSVPYHEYELFVARSYPIRPEDVGGNWLSDTEYVMWGRSEEFVVNVETRSVEPYSRETALQNQFSGSVSPDGTHMSFDHRRLTDGSGYYVRASENGTMAIYNNGGTTIIYDNDGTVRFFYPSHDTTVSQTGRWIASFVRGWDSSTASENTLLINTEDGTTVALCTLVNTIQFSPDDSQVAVLHGSGDFHRLWISDLTSWKATPIAYPFPPTSELIGWWNIEGG